VLQFFEKLKAFVSNFFIGFKNIFSPIFQRARKNPHEFQKNLDKKLIFSLGKSRWPNIKQIKYLPRVLAPKEKKIINGLGLVIFACLLVIVFNFYLTNIKMVPAAGGEYVEGLVGSPRYINPLLAQNNDADLDISALVFSGLFRKDKELVPVSDLVSSYNISTDGKVYTLFLRQDAFWQDGETLSADDIIFTINSIQNPEFRSPLSWRLTGVTAEKIDDHTVKLSLLEPYGPFLENLTFGILPAHLWSEVPPINANLAEYNTKPIGSGPWQFKSLTKDKFGNVRSYTLVRNEKYYGQKPYINKITFKFYSDFPSLVDALNSKEIEGLSLLPKEYRETIKNKNAKFYSFELPQYTALFINPQHNDILKDKNIRQALAYGIDREKILAEVLKSEGQLADGPIMPGFSGYNPDIKKYAYSQATAKELLDKTNWKPDGTIRKNKTKELEINLVAVDQPENNKTAELIKKNWEALGIKVNLEIVSGTEIQKDIIAPRSYDILLYSEVTSNDPDLYPFWHSSQVRDPGLNLTNLPNRHGDELLETARTAQDRATRDKNYTQFQTILAEDLPAIFLYYPTYTYLADKKIKGLDQEHIIVPADRFIGLANWYINTKRSWK